MKRLAALYFMSVALGLVACAAIARVATPTHTIDAMTVGPLILSVCDQHDESVERDPLLVQAEKDQMHRSTALLRSIIDEAMRVPGVEEVPQ